MQLLNSFFLLSTYVTITAAADVDAILSGLTTEQKIGQMTQLEIGVFMNGDTNVDYDKLREWMTNYHIGSILNSPFSGGPIEGQVGWTPQQWRDIVVNIQEIAKNTSNLPVLYGIDSIHGASYIYGATLFPQQLATAATFNTDLARECGRVTGKDTRAAAIPWIFSPVLGIALNPLWPRFWETFGEDPYLAATMGASLIEGIQMDLQDGGIPARAAACMKHFISYSSPENGHDRAPVQLSDRSMKQIFLPSFQAAIDAGALTAMESYNDLGGVPMASSSEYLIDLIRYDMGFEGMLVTDWAEIENLNTWHKVASSQKEAVKMALQDTSIDMSMVPSDISFYTYTLELVKDGVISSNRLDDSVRRVLQVKNTLGLLDTPVPPLSDPLVATVGQDEDWTSALYTARESITLLKNQAASLPLQSSAVGVGQSVFITGPTSDSLRAQTGGWTFHWQGAADDSEFSRGITVRAGLEQTYADATINYIAGPTFDAEDVSAVDMTAVVNAANAAELVVICIGEDTYTEKPGDINDLSLPAGQIEYVKSISNATETPIVLVIISGRPRLLNGIVDSVDAVLNAYLPGPMGGQAIAEIITGEVNPSGRLPYTYPKDSGSIPYTFHHKPSSQCVNSHGNYEECEVEWQFGTGLSYTTFSLSDVTLSSSSISETDSLTISVTVTNTGDITGKTSVLMFLFDMFRRVSPEYKLLKGFHKVELAPAEFTTVQFTLSAEEDLKYIGLDGRYVLEGGVYYVGIESTSDCRANTSGPLCQSFELQLQSDYSAICTAACDMWAAGVCGDIINGDTCAVQCRSEMWGWNYVDCLENTITGGCSNWLCYDSFSTHTSTASISANSSSCGDENYDYTSRDLVFATIISALAGLAAGTAATWMVLFVRFSARNICQDDERKSLITTQSPISSSGAVCCDSATSPHE